MALGKPAIIRFASVRPLAFRRSIISFSRLLPTECAPPPEITWSTPSCRIRRAGRGRSFLRRCARRRPPARPRGRSSACPYLRNAVVTVPAADGDAPYAERNPSAAAPAVFNNVRRDGLSLTAPISFTHCSRGLSPGRRPQRGCRVGDPALRSATSRLARAAALDCPCRTVLNSSPPCDGVKWKVVLDSATRCPHRPTCPRRFGLLQATALNMTNMMGVGPFITIPLLMTALGGPQAMLGWLVALLIVDSATAWCGASSDRRCRARAAATSTCARASAARSGDAWWRFSSSGSSS